ncbi:glycosyltransferase [Rheinheimera soli]|uniref:Colanic acid biosynthesis glycosyltransferase n=1 Tax=Rheinheimera soli TaxID=443616 RepID=A0ABU1VU82_9GAMM|nr:glycosyltransferase [Rheinheimera soli]MDR7119276.1 putative colanic acid biosynthesis glycosyltransferase [Rheinheimera soli]
MNILQINVCLDKGGAAKVALDLHNNLQKIGVNSQFAYGWGVKGGKSDSESNVKNCFRIGSKLQVITNFVFHNFFGFDLFSPFGVRRSKLLEAIKMADVVHLHVIHSYFIKFSWILDAIASANKPVVWTSHDYWILTGRCSSVGDCNKWQSGCGNCPNLSSYPATFLDFSATEFKRKRMYLSKISSNLVLVSPSSFLANELKKELPNVDVCHIPNWLDKNFEDACRNNILANELIKLPFGSVNVLVVSNNLDDTSKVNKELIISLLDLKGVFLHTIGKNSPFSGKNVFNHGEITDRIEMVKVISSCDVSLFTSKIDTFGLVMIESLACGVPVLAVKSKAAEEVLLGLNIKPVDSYADIIELIRSRTLPTEYINKTRESLQVSIFERFGHSAATENYVKIYKRLISANKLS